ncbi:unnamed protein product [Spodoptera exigua]|nr:unnamed protein product [Spodoptera exigua]
MENENSTLLFILLHIIVFIFRLPHSIESYLKREELESSSSFYDALILAKEADRVGELSSLRPSHRSRQRFGRRGSSDVLRPPCRYYMFGRQQLRILGTLCKVTTWKEISSTVHCSIFFSQRNCDSFTIDTTMKRCIY